MISNQIQILLSTLILLIVECTGEELKLVYQWTQLDAPAKEPDKSQVVFDPKDKPHQFNETFNAYGNLPMGIAHHKGRLFVSIPRRRPGIPSTLAVINMHAVQGVNNPPLVGYPEQLVNTLHCNEAYAYIPDYQWPGLYVYSLAENRMWRFNHNYFCFEPQNGRFNVAGIRFDWNDGIFSLAVGQVDSTTGHRMVYLHAMAAVGEIAVSNAVLKNETLARSGDEYSDLFIHLGSRGPNTHSSSHAFDEKTGVLFYAEVNRNSIGCWNSKRRFDADNHGIVHLDNSDMIYPADLVIDTEGVLWVISNKLPIWIYSKLNVTDFNYRIWRQTTKSAINGTLCM
ncbi:L-dopachrome tautomerase yellow-f-like [Topomyia yanbarensis]|uniref:L-dopachrome tautomerase yellow-f-like n=1 Tax=Topomyia yanbarensis TaxID=2498891 RepID=UPI00273CD9E6|nr:L-dopachrome tautomerase yellow-f-like [Topomyia yanbarensis]